MDFKRIGNKVIIRIDCGEEIIQTVKQICTQLHIKAGTITGIGATNKATIGLYDTKTKTYHAKELTGDHEIAPLLGNITTMNNDVYLHLHVNLCNKDHVSLGGHLTAARVSVTFEGIIDVFDDNVGRVFDENTGLNLLKLNK
ncbi:MAG: PPC domain-containing DNA-binding protein [Methanobacteriota archaeon]